MVAPHKNKLEYMSTFFSFFCMKPERLFFFYQLQSIELFSLIYKLFS